VASSLLAPVHLLGTTESGLLEYDAPFEPVQLAGSPCLLQTGRLSVRRGVAGRPAARVTAEESPVTRNQKAGKQVASQAYKRLVQNKSLIQSREQEEIEELLLTGAPLDEIDAIRAKYHAPTPGTTSWRHTGNLSQGVWETLKPFSADIRDAKGKVIQKRLEAERDAKVARAVAMRRSPPPDDPNQTRRRGSFVRGRLPRKRRGKRKDARAAREEAAARERERKLLESLGHPVLDVTVNTRVTSNNATPAVGAGTTSDAEPSAVQAKVENKASA